MSRPARIWNTAPDWISIITGASSADMMTSTMNEIVRRMPPPQARRSGPFTRYRNRPKILGASRISIVAANSVSDRSASNRGHVGNSENSLVKYSGRMNLDCSTMVIPTISWNSHSGEAR